MNNSEKMQCFVPPKKWDDSGVYMSDSSTINIDSGCHITDESDEKTITDTNKCVEKVDDDDCGITSDAFTHKSGITLRNVNLNHKCDTILLRDAYIQNADGDTLLHLAIIQGLSDVTYYLIAIVPHPDFLDIYNHLSQTPLHLSTLTKQPNVVRRLIVSGATLDLRDRHGNTALHIACKQGDVDSVKALISPITEKEVNAVAVRNYPIVAQCLPKDLLQLKNYEGETCIHLAAYNKNNKKIIENLVQCGADINAQEGKSGKSVLHWAVEMQQYDLIQFLIKKCRANVNIQSYARHTPLHIAWSIHQRYPNSARIYSMIKFLLDCGGEPSLPPADSDNDYDNESDDVSDDDEKENEIRCQKLQI